MKLPDLFTQRMKSLLKDEYDLFINALDEVPPVSIRLNPFKKTSKELNHQQVMWSELGYYLPERPTFTFDPLFHAGAYYVQEASSMFLEQIIKSIIDQPVKALDLCAAPGGKSTHLLSLLPEGSILVSNEVIRQRSRVLSENLIKWGTANTIVVQNDPKEISKLTQVFDFILVDAPCSGEGMFRKDPESITEWSLDNVMLCAARQRRILADAWLSLRPGGFLVYSTCTYNTEENEDNLRFLMEELEANPVTIPTNKAWNITGALTGNYPAYRFFPHKTKGEGFFVTVVQKKAEVDKEARKTKNKKQKTRAKQQTPSIASEVKKMVLDNENYHYTFSRDSTIQAYSEQLQDFLSAYGHLLRIISSGITIGNQKGKDLIPDISLALNTALNKDAFTIQEVTLEDSIRFLQKEALTLPSHVPNGFVLLTYKHTPIGFAKQIGTRANNLFPQEWKIKTRHIPEQIKLVDI